MVRSGLGWLRAAAGIGAAVMATTLALRPLNRHVGLTLFVVVGIFGAATIVLGVTHSFAIAFVSLIVLSAADAVSVFIRSTLTPLVTPTPARGRVLAVENVFIGASNELGAFESGVAGQLLGVGPAVVLGGAMTLVCRGDVVEAVPVVAQRGPRSRTRRRRRSLPVRSLPRRRSRLLWPRGVERVRAWAVGNPGPIATRPLEPVERADPTPAAARSASRSACAASAAPISTSPRATSSRGGSVSCPVTRSSARSMRSARASTRFSSRASASGSPGCATRAASVASACAATRTCASRLGSRAGTTTAATPSGPWSTRPTRYALPDGFDDEHAAPLLCAGIIGYRALRRSRCRRGGRLGIYGFGASAHITAQVALFEGATVHVLTRSAAAQRLALELGATSAGERTTLRRSLSMLRSSSRRRRPGAGRDARARPWRHSSPSRASTSATSRR